MASADMTVTVDMSQVQSILDRLEALPVGEVVLTKDDLRALLREDGSGNTTLRVAVKMDTKKLTRIIQDEIIKSLRTERIR